MDSVLELESGNFNVLFRTSEATTFSGFEMYVICFEPLERGLPGLLNCDCLIVRAGEMGGGEKVVYSSLCNNHCMVIR